MDYLLNAREMKTCDSFTIHKMGVPSAVLMERAALVSVEEITNAFGRRGRILVLCGSGNNGGDGFAVARLLLLEGIETEVCFAGNEASLTDETRLQKKIYENYGGKYCRKSDWSEYTVLVDALFGIGLSRPVSGEYEKLIRQVNVSGLPVAAIDMPSGISADTGEVMGCAVRAKLTVTFGFLKRGQILYPGTEYCGKLVVRDIGITAHGLPQTPSPAFTYKREDLRLLPERTARSNKGTYGTVLLIAGAENMAGAALLGGSAAYRCGCGLVRILSEDGNREIIQTALPEAVFVPWREEGALKRELSRARVVGIGPGLGNSDRAEELLKTLLKQWEGPLVIDADGLNLLAAHPGYLSGTEAQLIVTPHPGEMARLTGADISEILKDIAAACRSYASGNRLICVLKDARTAVSDGKQLYLNTSGNDGMAVGGSGDVLTGIICGLLAQGMQPFPAACSGVFLHGLAGDHAAGALGKRSMTAMDIVNGIAGVLSGLRGDEHRGMSRRELG